MRKICEQPSILPYLSSVNGSFSLCLQLLKSNQTASVTSSDPFVSVADEDPLAKIFQAAFITDSGSIIKKINLLIQRDALNGLSEQSTGLNNSIIDQYWQQAVNIRVARSPERSMLLAAQLEGQQFLAFSPLFYCRRKQHFFEPCCSGCGKVLQLCKDDNLLQTAGLAPYSSSLRRYLHCPSCDVGVWYSLERKADDPPTVRDCRQLILTFSQMDQTQTERGEFPCTGCLQQEKCFGERQGVYDAISVISFYPFYMLISEYDSLDGFQMFNVFRTSHYPAAQTEVSLSTKSTADSSGSEEQNQDQAISAIMQKLAGKYKNKIPIIKDPPASINASPVSPQATENETINDLSLETVIIGTPDEYQPMVNDTLQTDTVLLSGNPTITGTIDIPRSKNEPLPDKQDTADVDDLAETVIIPPGTKI